MRKHHIIKKEDNIPLIGVNLFGIIDRGTNVLQIRAITGCPLNCIYCSVDEGNDSKKNNTYEVETNYLLEEINKLVEYKQTDDIEAHIDGMGEPLLNKNIVELVKGLRKNKKIKTISMQTNGILLTDELLKKLEQAGLDRINLSLNSFNFETARTMSGLKHYNVEKIIETAKKITKSKIKLLLAPVLVPNYNEEMDEIIKFAKENNALIGIQKYESYKYGRRLKVKEWTWYKFFEYLKKYEKKYDIKLILSKKDFGIHSAKHYKSEFKKGQTMKGKVILNGWLNNEVIVNYNDKLITVFNSTNDIGDLINFKIIKTKHNITLATKI